MIDTDKYEETVWDLTAVYTHTEMADEVLLLVAEVKRLREENNILVEAVKEDNEILKKHIETLAELKEMTSEVKRWHKVRDYILKRASYPTIKKLHLKDLLNFMEEVIE